MNKFYDNDTRWCRFPDFCEFMLFRRSFEIARKEKVDIAVSADNRYNLYLDGKLLGRGPCRGDLLNYHYEEYRFTLSSGKHVLAAEVAVFPNTFRKSESPWSEVHAEGAFLVAGGCDSISLATPGEWRSTSDRSRSFRKWSEVWDCQGTVPAPPMEDVNFSAYPGNWTDIAFDDRLWDIAEPSEVPHVKGMRECDPSSIRHLVSRSIPQMMTEFQPVSKLYQPDCCTLLLTDGVICGTVPAGHHIVRIDLGRNQTSMIRFAGKDGSGTCRIAYSEILFYDGERNFDKNFEEAEIAGQGIADLLRFSSGGWEFNSFWYRSGRYLELDFMLDESVTIDNLYVDFISYPFELKAKFEQDGKPDLNRIYDVSWHTARCCAHEHYEDCPYWEQLQYLGDTRIQALISYSATGDGRLGRQAIRQFDASRLPCGLTQSRYPTTRAQIIPQFSLFWILMIEDNYDYFGDKEVIREHLTGIRSVMEWFEAKREANGLIGHVGYWCITDWVAMWPGGKSSRGTEKPETIISMIYADCCRVASRLFNELNMNNDSAIFKERCRQSLEAVNALCYSPESGMYRDVPDKEWYSQHVNAWAIISGAADKKQYSHLIKQIMNNQKLAQCSLYFSFYLMEAMRKAGADDEFEALFDKWQDMLELGFTTFPEVPSIESRSHCHAWSSGPLYEIIRFYFGVSPLRPGFEEVLIAPHPGSRKNFSGTVPAGDALITLKWSNDNGVFTLTLETDRPISGKALLPGCVEPYDIDLKPSQSTVLAK